MSGIALEDFVAEAKVFLDANAEPRSEQKFVWGEGPDRVGILDEKTPEEEAAELARGQGVEGQGVRRRLRLDHRPGGVRRPRRSRPRTCVRTGEAQSNYAIPSVSAVRRRPRDGRADDPRPRHPRGEGAVPASAVPR